MESGYHTVFPELMMIKNHFMVETPFKVSLNSSGLDHSTEENINWRKFKTGVLDLDH
jgi:hypothetical protein